MSGPAFFAPAYFTRMCFTVIVSGSFRGRSREAPATARHFASPLSKLVSASPPVGAAGSGLAPPQETQRNTMLKTQRIRRAYEVRVAFGRRAMTRRSRDDAPEPGSEVRIEREIERLKAAPCAVQCRGESRPSRHLFVTDCGDAVAPLKLNPCAEALKLG